MRPLSSARLRSTRSTRSTRLTLCNRLLVLYCCRPKIGLAYYCFTTSAAYPRISYHLAAYPCLSYHLSLLLIFSSCIYRSFRATFNIKSLGQFHTLQKLTSVLVHQATKSM